MTVVFRRCEVGDHLVDVLVDQGVISAIEPALAVPKGAVVVDGHGGALVPGLHDHHIHLLSFAASQRSVHVGPPHVTNRAQFVGALAAAAHGTADGGWVRAVGYHDLVAGALDRWALDALVANTPVRVQHRSGGLWIVSSAGLDRLGPAGSDGFPPGYEITADGAPTGRLFRLDGWLRRRLGPAPVPDLSAVGRTLLRHGVTGVTDATPVEDTVPLRVLADARRSGALPQRVTVTGAPSLELATVPTELRIGPAKILMPDHEPPTLDQLVDSVEMARVAGRTVAFHCVTRVSAVLAIAALDVVGALPGDRLEHGAVLPPDLRHEVARLGLTVVTQPNLVAERGDDYLADVDDDDLAHLWPCASLLSAGVAVAAGTDAPFGDPDPWKLIEAATLRRTPAGRVIGPEERLVGARALDLMLGGPDTPGRPRRLRAGMPADLCLLHVPLCAALADPAAAQVKAVVIGSEVHLLDGEIETAPERAR